MLCPASSAQRKQLRCYLCTILSLAMQQHQSLFRSAQAIVNKAALVAMPRQPRSSPPQLLFTSDTLTMAVEGVQQSLYAGRPGLAWRKRSKEHDMSIRETFLVSIDSDPPHIPYYPEASWCCRFQILPHSGLQFLLSGGAVPAGPFV